MEHPRLGASAALLALAALLAGCSTSPEPPAAGAPTTSSSPASASASPSPSLISTLSAEKQQAADQAATAVQAYRQTYYDILADPTPALNDVNLVAVQPQLAIALQNLQETLGDGKTVVTSTGPVTIAGVKVLKVDLQSNPHEVTLLVCVDTSKASGTTDGEPWVGGRNEMKYVVAQAKHLPGAGWAVAQVLPPTSKLTGSRPC